MAGPKRLDRADPGACNKMEGEVHASRTRRWRIEVRAEHRRPAVRRFPVPPILCPRLARGERRSNSAKDAMRSKQNKEVGARGEGMRERYIGRTGCFRVTRTELLSYRGEVE